MPLGLCSAAAVGSAARCSPQRRAPPDPPPARRAGEDAVLLATGGDDQAIHVAVLGLDWPRGGGALRLSARATLRLPNAHGSAVRVWRGGPCSS
jgi:hypothetical protein